MERKQPKKAIALGYKKYNRKAPIVVAKGERLLAEKIIALAQEHGIPIYPDPGLAQLLYRSEVGEEIPESLYLAVAKVLAFVYSLDAKVSSNSKNT